MSGRHFQKYINQLKNKTLKKLEKNSKTIKDQKSSKRKLKS